MQRASRRLGPACAKIVRGMDAQYPHTSRSVAAPSIDVGSPPLRDHWALDPAVIHLNHGSFGACPRKVLAAQSALRDELERQPGAFFTSVGARIAVARRALGAFVGADPNALAFTPNVTFALNSAIGSSALGEGDELLVTNHEYNATRQIALAAARRAGARCTVAELPFVGADRGSLVEGVLSAVTPRTRVAVLDHVTSQTGLVLPLAELVPELEARDIAVIVDGAHAPGMIELDIEALAPSWYTGNCHKWLCAPKSAGFLWAREDVIERTRSAIVSHGAGVAEPRARFRLEFDWPGTVDPTAALSVPAALDFMGGLLPGGWEALRARNHALCVAGRRVLCEALEIEAPFSDDLVGSMAALPLPAGPGATDAAARSALDRDPLRALLLEHDAIEVPVLACDAHPGRLIRVSAAAYNAPEDFEALARALRRHLFA